MSFLVGFATGALNEVNRRYDAHRDDVKEREKNIREALERAAPEIAKRREKAASYNTRYNLALSYGAPEHMAHAYGVSDMGDDILATNIRQYKLAEQTRAAAEANKPVETPAQATPTVAIDPAATTAPPATAAPTTSPYKTTPPPPAPATPMTNDPNNDRSFVDTVLGMWPKGSAQYSAYEAIAMEKGVWADDVMKEYSDILAGQFGPQLPEAPPTPAGAPPLVFVTEQQAMEKANEWFQKNQLGFKTPDIAKQAHEKFYNAYLKGDGPGMAEATGMYNADLAAAREAEKRSAGDSQTGQLTQGQLRNQLLQRLQPYFQGDIVVAADQNGNTTASIRDKAETAATIGDLLDEAESRIIASMGPNMQKIPLGVVVQTMNEVAAERGLKRGQPAVPGQGGEPAAAAPGQDGSGQPGQTDPPPPVEEKKNLTSLTEKDIYQLGDINLTKLIETLEARVSKPVNGAPTDKYKELLAIAKAEQSARLTDRNKDITREPN